MCAGPLLPFKIQLEVVSGWLGHNHATVAAQMRQEAMASFKREHAARDSQAIYREHDYRRELVRVMGEITQIP